jgi:hypothetical protein
MPRTASGRRPAPRTRLRPWPARAVGKPTLDFGLVDDDVIEGKIIASRPGAAVVEGAGSEWNDLRLRMKRLERGDDLASDDPLRPEVLAQALLKAWTDQGLTRPMWRWCTPACRRRWRSATRKPTFRPTPSCSSRALPPSWN